MNVPRRARHSTVAIVLASLLLLLLAAGAAHAGAIAGTVTTAGGTPIGGSRVDALQVMGGGVYTLRASAFVARADGAYLVDGLPAGTYVVRFQGNATYMREHYDNVPNRSLAAPIAVPAGGTVAGIDAVLAPYPKLRGTVTSIAGAPVAGAVVTVVRAQSQEQVASGVTAAGGAYAFTVGDDQAAVSTYKVRFDDPLGAYLGEWHSDKGSFESADALALAPGSTTAVDARLVQAGFVSGRLTDQDGDPIAGVAVRVLGPSGAVFERLVSAADGSYASAGLPPGDYKLDFGAGSLYVGFEYYEDETDFAAADVVRVVGGATAAGVDAVLRANGAIGGSVADARGQPVDFTTVRVYTPTGTLVGFNHTTDGRYLIGQLPPGDYKVRFEPSSGDGAAQWYAARGTLQSADAVTVVKGATTGGIDARLGVGARIVGTVGAPGGLASPVTVDVFDADGQWVGSTLTRGDASYAFEGLLPGRYRMRFVPIPESGLMMEWHDDKPSLDTADPIAIDDGETVTVNPTLESGKTISGHVTRTDGRPVRQAAVVVYDASGSTVVITHTNSDGAYSASGLAAGSYRLRFVGPGSPLDVDYNGDTPPDAGYVESEFYDNKSTLEAATSVSVTAQTTTVNAQLASTGSIWGTVRTADGAPLKGARVFLVREDGRRAGPFLTTWRGTYRAELLRPGRWKLFFASPYTAYASSYYDDKSTLAAADAVAVVDHVTTTGIDAALVRQPALLDDSAPFALTGR